MHSSLVITLLIVCGCAANGFAATIPTITEEYNSQPIPTLVAPCNVNDESRDECIKNEFLTIIPLLNRGIPELNMESVDPYFFKKGIFRYANDGVQGGLLVKNMNIYGISRISVRDFLSNFTGNNFVINMNATLPRIQASGQFKADVKFGGLRLVPKGLFNITIDNIKANILTDGGIVDMEAGRRIQLNKLDADISVGHARIAANGIFSDSNLNAMILNLVNENLPEIIRVGIPATRDQWAPIIVEHLNGFFAKVPIDKLISLE
ncbi:uncharacterized protein LOC129916393 [Episyrphus balteatus]|uniref:uncharacterized protein LOC129916393 n=1 Tax=Episyrphus balteatus TaxID=286459 RepID=UPI002484F963|nr:uncharacterized protein LOC129916393 [Episyrphus balteatus]